MGYPEVSEVQDHERGCGWRKEGGFYLMAGGFETHCYLLPVPLVDCPHCGTRVTATRAMRRINFRTIFGMRVCPNIYPEECRTCVSQKFDMGYLMLVGSGFYKTPTQFLEEANRDVGGKLMGISKRIPRMANGMPMLPKEFKVGESPIALSHHAAIVKYVPTPDGKLEAEMHEGIFAVFIPDRIEYIVRESDTEEELQKLVDNGITLVRIKRMGVAEQTTGEQAIETADEEDAE